MSRVIFKSDFSHDCVSLFLDEDEAFFILDVFDNLEDSIAVIGNLIEYAVEKNITAIQFRNEHKILNDLCDPSDCDKYYLKNLRQLLSPDKLYEEEQDDGWVSVGNKNAKRNKVRKILVDAEKLMKNWGNL